MNRPTPIVDLIPYHISNFGTAGGPIFNAPEDYHHFIDLLNIAVPRHAIRLFAWSLLPTEFHLVMSQELRGNIPGALHLIETAAARWFNRRYRRTGRLFAGPYRNDRILSQESLDETISLIHQLPVRNGLVPSRTDWPWQGRDTGNVTRAACNNLAFEGVPRTAINERVSPD